MGISVWKSISNLKGRSRKQRRGCIQPAWGTAPGHCLGGLWYLLLLPPTPWGLHPPGLNGMMGYVCRLVSGKPAALLLCTSGKQWPFWRGFMESGGGRGVFPIPFVLSCTAHTLNHQVFFGVATCLYGLFFIQRQALWECLNKSIWEVCLRLHVC